MFSIKKNFRISNNIKKLFINFSFRSGVSLLGKVFALITLPIITRALGPEGYGNFSLINVIVEYTLLPVGLLGLKPYGIREIAKHTNEKKIVNNVLSSQISIVIPAIIISVITVFCLFHSKSLLFISVLIAYLIVIARVFDIEFFFIGNKNLVFPTVSRLIGKIFFFFFFVLFIKNPNNLPQLIFFSAISPTIASIIQITKYLKLHHKIHLRLSIKDSIQLLKKTYKLGISTNLEVLYPSIPIILLPILLNTYYLGIYAAGYKVFSIMVLFYVAFFYALAPYLVQLKEFNEKRRTKYILLLFGLLFIVGITIGLVLYFFGEHLLLLLLGKSFGEAVPVFKAISLTLIPLWPVFILFGNILIYFGVEKYYMRSLFASTILVAILAPVLINRFYVLGAVFAMAISLFAAILTSGYYVIKIEPALLSYIKSLFVRM